MSSDSYRRWLASLDDDHLATLLRSRPDTVLPPPPGITPLSGRLQLRASVARALRRLSALELATMEAAADLGAELAPVTRSDVVASLTARLDEPVDGETVERAVDTLFGHGIFYGDLQLLKEAMPALPTGWSLLATRPPEDLSTLLAELPDEQRRVLTTLASAGGIGHSRDAAIDADPGRPIPRLIAAGLLDRTDSQHVRLPRAVLQMLRGQQPSPIPLVPVTRSDAADPQAQSRTDASGAAQGLEFTRRVARLVEHLGTQPAALNKDGRPSARLASALAKALGTDAAEAALLTSLAHSAGLVGMGLAAHVPEPLDPDANYLAPTREADAWLEASLPDRWSLLIDGWLTSPWAHWHDGRVLSDELRVEALPARRRHVLEQFSRLPAGVSVSDAEAISDTRFAAPLLTESLSDTEISALLDEAREVGVLVRGCATSVVRALLGGEDTAEATREHAPAEVTQVIVQADMTVMVPGPLPAGMQAELELFADLETPGLASMYRVTKASIHRALDAGRDPEDITGWLSGHALGEVPQAVAYLVGDVARRHGTLRGGVALSYLRSSDESVLAEVLRSPAAAQAELRALAPTVAVSPRRLAAVIDVLRRAGFQPVAEDDAGISVDVRAEPARVFSSPRGRTQRAAPPVDEARITAAVAAIRRNEGAGSSEPAPEPDDHVAVLQAAARARRPVTIAAVDKTGRALSATVKPLTVSGGQVDAIDESTGQVHRFLVHRITRVTLN